MRWCVKQANKEHPYGHGNQVVSFLATPPSLHPPLQPPPSSLPPPSLIPSPFSSSISPFKNKLLNCFRSWSRSAQLELEPAMGCCCCWPRPCPRRLSLCPLLSLQPPLFKKFSNLRRKCHFLPKQSCAKEECVYL